MSFHKCHTTIKWVTAMNVKSRSIMWLIVVFVVMHLRSNDANARVLYFKVWRSVYGESGRKTGCSLCHPGKEKRVLNNYGKKLFKELDERDVRDVDRIERAIRKIGKPGNATQNKELPASHLNSRPQVPTALKQQRASIESLVTGTVPDSLKSKTKSRGSIVSRVDSAPSYFAFENSEPCFAMAVVSPQSFCVSFGQESEMEYRPGLNCISSGGA